MTVIDPYADLIFGPPEDDPGSASPNGQQHRRKPLADRLLSMSQLANLPEPDPLIKNTIDLDAVSLIAGSWGTLKTFVALDWCASIATGKAWLGRSTVQRRVLYIAGEGAHGIYGRLHAWQTAWRRDIPDDGFSLLPNPIHLLNPLDIAELCEVVIRGGYGVVMVDTISKSIPGADENSAKDMSVVVHGLYEILRATNGGAVVALHHTGKDRSTVRGSSALEAGVDCVYLTEGNPDALTLTRTKRRDGPREDTQSLRFRPVPGTGSGVIERTDDLGNSPSADRLLSLMDSHFSETGATKKELVDASGMPTTTAYRAVNDLLRTGHIVNRGTDARPRYYKDSP